MHDNLELYVAFGDKFDFMNTTAFFGKVLKSSGFGICHLSLFFIFRLSGFQAFRLSGFQAFRLSGFQAFRISGSSPKKDKLSRLSSDEGAVRHRLTSTEIYNSVVPRNFIKKKHGNDNL